jgi:regulator of cell morphogenesis and NO signaling
MKNIQLDENVQELIDKDFVLARALFFLGVTYCDYKDSSLELVLKEAGISAEKLNRKLEELHGVELPGPDFFKSFQVDAIVEYLKHAHYVYIKEKIPYISTLIARLEDSGKLTHDLKLIFPYVTEDFIKHIYHEEDSLFYYVQKLYAATDGVFEESVMLELMRKYSISKMASHHESDDDEMKGIRDLTNNYSVEGIDDKDLKVIFNELKSLETDLLLHARIENEVLFPKALELEAKVAKFVAESIKTY